MTAAEQTFDALRAAARPTAAFVAILGMLLLVQLAGHASGDPVWSRVFSWETFGTLSFFAYAAFILLPVYRVRPPVFWAMTVLGTVVGIGSVSMTQAVYSDLLADFLNGSIVYHILAWILLVPIYTYIPIMIINRERWAANKGIQKIAS